MIMLPGLEVSAVETVEPEAVARLVHFGRNKRGPYAVFNQGTSTGFVVGREVCIYDLAREKISCLSIERAKPRAAAIYLPDDVRIKSKLGFFVWPGDLGAPVFPKNSEAPYESKSIADVSSLAREEDDPPEPVLPPLLARRLQVHLAPTVSLPVWMNDLRFNPTARASGSGDIWESGDTIKGSAVGFGARYHWPQNGAGDAAIDVTYHFVPQKPIRDDFDFTDAAVAVQSEVWSHHFRVRWLRGATWRHRDASDLLLYTGLGYDVVRIRFRSVKTGASSDELVSGQMMGHGLEIPVVVAWQRFFGDWMLTAGADAALPLGLLSVTMTGKLSYRDDVADADKSLDKAAEAVNVRRGWFSLAVQIGLGRRL
jgi:hypothetical protein